MTPNVIIMIASWWRQRGRGGPREREIVVSFIIEKSRDFTTCANCTVVLLQPETLRHSTPTPTHPPTEQPTDLNHHHPSTAPALPTQLHNLFTYRYSLLTF